MFNHYCQSQIFYYKFSSQLIHQGIVQKNDRSYVCTSLHICPKTARHTCKKARQITNVHASLHLQKRKQNLLSIKSIMQILLEHLLKINIALYCTHYLQTYFLLVVITKGFFEYIRLGHFPFGNIVKHSVSLQNFINISLSETSVIIS